ncbi:DUF4270 domain-containing protein [Chitinophaga horti]|uniref:DUF4270 domain-containing protein n=1 Tax=Chitinophaga horti TaxID=2920382 RepID=A0ABY6J2J2_9BACT|nr:DUF4270 domain-containing protein [Chitinophaga horti]UYQ93855.1 DUF4270 domain-containing protein [Chitinophaga horti]
MRKISCLLIAASACYLAACEKSGFSYEDVNTENGVGYILLDTFSVDVKTVLLDSVPSSGQNVILNGFYNDPIFGKITAGSFFEVGLPDSRKIENNMVYDSTELILRSNGYYYGDTMVPQNIQVYQLAQNINMNEGSSYLYTHHSFATQSSPLGSRAAYIRPLAKDTVSIRLADSKGQEIWDLFANNANEVSGASQWLDYFKGFAIRTGTTNAIYGYNATTAVMRIHYHINSLERGTSYFEFPLSNSGYQFNNIQADRTGTAIAGLTTTNNSISSTNLDNAAYMQGLTGIATRLDFPSIKKSMELGKFGKIITATLTVQPIRNTYTQYNLPAKVCLVKADSKQNTYDTLMNSTNGGYQYGDLSIDHLYNENTAYTYDLTSYCTSELTTDNITTRGLLMLPTYGDYLTKPERLVIGDKLNSKNKMTFKIYYLLYK